MKSVTSLAVVQPERCDGCRICYAICPTAAIVMENRKAVIEATKCLGCSNCEQRCPEYAITMVALDPPWSVGVDPARFDAERIAQACFAARLHPEQVICFCTGTRAGEVAAAILGGAKTPEEVSLQTGARTGCKVLCIEPILRQLLAAGIRPEPTDGYQWCMVDVDLWGIDKDVERKYADRGFYFDADREFLEANLRFEQTNWRER